jgi:hypothetical protein
MQAGRAWPLRNTGRESVGFVSWNCTIRTSSRFHGLCCCFRVSRYPHFPYYELAPVNAKYVCLNFPQLAIDMLFLQLLADELRSCESIRYRCLYFAFVLLRLRSRRL